MPASAGLWVGRRIGDLAFAVLGRRRRLAIANITTAFPELPARERRHICRRAWQHLGMMFVELCGVLTHPLERTLDQMTVEGAEHLKDVMEREGRALIVTAHLGNWELLSVAHRLIGYPLTIVVRPLDAPWLNVVAERLRLMAGVEVVDKRGALRPVLTALRGGRLVGILLDQNASRSEGIFVPFFARPANTSKSLGLMAMRTQTPVVPIFIRREPDGRHRVLVRAALRPPARNAGEAGVVHMTMRCTEAIEAAIAESPEQWLWIHNRWRTRPPGSVSGRG